VRDREPGIIVGNGRPGWRRQGWNEVSALRSTREPATSRVRIGRDSGRIEEIGIGAIRGTTYIRDVIVRFGNGEERRIAVDRRVDADRLVHRIRLERGRFIDRIEIEHRREGRGPAFSEFALLLRPAQGRRPFPDRPVEPPPPVSTDDWIKLGSRKAAMLSRDFDSIIVGRGEGRFSAVRIRVRRHDVRFYGTGPGTDEADESRFFRRKLLGGLQTSLVAPSPGLGAMVETEVSQNDFDCLQSDAGPDVCGPTGFAPPMTTASTHATCSTRTACFASPPGFTLTPAHPDRRAAAGFGRRSSPARARGCRGPTSPSFGRGQRGRSSGTFISSASSVFGSPPSRRCAIAAFLSPS